MRNTKIEEEHLSSEVIDCRWTGKGARTFVVRSENARVIKQNSSKSGNHWEELILFFSPQSYVVVKDVSNSGKHNCYGLTPAGVRWPDSCGKCALEGKRQPYFAEPIHS